jgi:hypothetical protein
MASFGQLLIDIKYANLLSGRLERWKIKKSRPYLSNFRCPFCGDSKKNRAKARGFLYEEKNELHFKCWNGCRGKKFRTFLRDINPLLEQEYSLESFKENHGGSDKRSQARPTESKEASRIEQGLQTDPGYLSRLKTIRELKSDHPVRRYVESRQVPDFALDILRYCPAFVKFTNSIIPGKLPAVRSDEPRLIIPFNNRDGKFIGYQGRGFGDGLRYISIMLDPDETKVFGMDRVDFNKKVYVLEGAIDSFFLPNAVAAIQGDLLGIDHLLKGRRCVYIPDKDRRNKQIIRLINRLIVNNKDVCLLPESVPGKDLNEMILMGGVGPQDLQKLVDDHTYSGLRLQLEFAKWKKT